MKIYRYMSREELKKYLNGEDIVGQDQSGNISTAGAQAVCFIGEITDVQGDKYSPKECYKFLSGIVSDEVLVGFEVDEANVSEVEAVYAEPTTDYVEIFNIFHARKMTIKEYSMPMYNDTLCKVESAVFGDEHFSSVFDDEDDE